MSTAETGNKPARHWCFTSFHYDKFPANEWPSPCRYVVYQIEKCPETQRLHAQGYIELSRPVRFTQVKTILGDTSAHVSSRRGTREEARDYAMKEDTREQGPYEWGKFEAGGSGTRNDLEEVATMVKEKKTYSEICLAAPTVVMKYHRGIKELINVRDYVGMPQWRGKPEVHVYWGDPGAGKTKRAVEEITKLFPNELIYTLPPPRENTGLWWDMYEQQHAILIDDFYGWIRYSELLRILDGYKMIIQVKGSTTIAAWTHIFITSNAPPNKWYSYNDETLVYGALERRITKVEHLRVERQLDTAAGVLIGRELTPPSDSSSAEHQQSY